MQPKPVKKHQHQKREQPSSRRRSDAPKEKSPTEVMIEKEDPSVDLHCWRSCLLLHVGSHVVETTYTTYEPRAAAWFTDTLPQLRHLRRRGGPQLVSLCVFKGVRSKNSWRYTGGPNQPSNPYVAFSICLGGSHVLFYRHEDYYDDSAFSRKPLKRLLEDKNVVVVGMGINEIAKKLQDQCGLWINRPVDLRMLMAGAYGKDSVWWPRHEKGRVVIDNVGLEEMARTVLEDTRLEKKPARVLEADWGGNYWNCGRKEAELEMDLIKYAARDAFISYEIATKCIEKTGLPSEASLAEED